LRRESPVASERVNASKRRSSILLALLTGHILCVEIRPVCCNLDR